MEDEIIREETVMCDDYIRALTQLKDLLYRICYENDVSLQQIEALQGVCNRGIVVDTYIDVIIPNLEIVVPLASGEVQMMQVSDPEDVKLCKKYMQIVGLCEDVLSMLKSEPDAFAS